MKIGNTPEVLNFGKYKGQPVEVLAQDKQYADWLMAQDWFKERYSSLRTLIVNNFNTVAETPEHNSMQALFVEDDFVEKVVNKLFNKKMLQEEIGWYEKNISTELEQTERLIISHEKSITEGDKYYTRESEEKRLNDCIKRKEEILNRKRILNDSPIEAKIHKIGFECRGIDVVIHFSFSKGQASYSSEAKIELKPSLGDDYPGILRQMKSSQSNILVIKDYTGVGASYEQVCKIFKTGGIKIILLTDIS